MSGHRLASAIAVLVALVAQPIAIAGASNWGVGVDQSAGRAQSGSAPGVPTTVTASCTSFLLTTVDLGWDAVSGATSYTVYESTTSSAAGFAPVATGVVGTAWTSPSLPTGSYWFAVVAYVGDNWAGAMSTASAQRNVAVLFCT